MRVLSPQIPAVLCYSSLLFAMSADDASRSPSTPSIQLVSIESAADPLLPAFRQLVRDFLKELGESLDYQGVEEELAARQHSTTQRRSLSRRSVRRCTAHTHSPPSVCCPLCAVPGKYSRSERGCMYIAIDCAPPSTAPSHLTPTPVGCIGLRQLEHDTGEVKRMFVDPRYRGQRVAERLLNTVIQQARTMQYTKLRLDTLARLQSANRLYRRAGFHTIPAYNDCPIEGAMWFELDLSAKAAQTADNTTLP